MDAQDYLPEERDAIDAFLNAGGGLIALAGLPSHKPLNVNSDVYANWPLRRLLQSYGADIRAENETSGGMHMLALDPGDWEVIQRGDGGQPIACRRTVGKGRIVLLSSATLTIKAVHYDKADLSEAEERKRLDFFRECLAWASAGKPPVGGDRRIPSTYGGGGSIYPELEQRFGSIVVYYAKNQKPEVLEMVEKEYGAVQDQCFKWLPSKVSEEPMYIVLASGMGGGWAVNAFYPKENGIVAFNRKGVLGIFAHELVHTMGGPRNTKGELAGGYPLGIQGDHHAGWYQGKAQALFCGEEDMPNRSCNSVLEKERETGEPEAYNTYGKIWYFWQKMDDRYGPTWYPRWYWVRTMCWMDDPGHEESWDEAIEDMCIAVAEDVFAFAKKLGIPVTRDRLERTEFLGEALELPIAPIEYTPAGNVNLEPIGDYTQPLPRPEA